MRPYFDIFTDAASYNNGRKIKELPEHSCSSAILCFNHKNCREFYKFNPDSTNNFGEIYAIYMGLKNSMKVIRSLKSVKPPYTINLYSDSMISVQGLRSWIYGWIKNSDDEGTWYNSSGTVVANQDIFKKIYYEYIMNPDIYIINFYHIRGHMNPNKKSDLEKAMKTFKDSNKRKIDLDELKYLIKMNDRCDRLAAEILDENL